VNLRSSFELSKLPYHIGAAIIVEAYGTTVCHCAPLSTRRQRQLHHKATKHHHSQPHAVAA
jgi:hypothetical protein